ncbi:MAG: hypothetical protein L3K01_07820 [Thermoplasmata archaeon]|nr:hypothetical protein [Thermoplasmata archaeon]
MGRSVTYDEKFLPAVEKLTRNDPQSRNQVNSKIAVIIDHPESIGRRTVNPADCRHVDVCHGRLVIFWDYDVNSDTVRFLKFETHKRSFR